MPDRETVVVPAGLLPALHRYLGTKPFAEVRQLVEGLEACVLADPGPAAEPAPAEPAPAPADSVDA